MNEMSHEKRYSANKIIHCPDDLFYVCSKGYFLKGETTEPMNFELPYPLHKPSFHEGPDKVTAFLKEKEEYEKLKKQAKPHMKSVKKTLSNYNSESALIPFGVLNLYKAQDPDIYSNCDYNLYYTGGSLECVSSDGIDYFVRPNFNDELVVWNPTTGNDSSTFYKGKTPILGLKTTYGSGGIFFTMREKYVISVIYTKEMTNCNAKRKWKHESCKVPYVDAKLNSHDSNTIATIAADFSLNIYDLKRNKVVNYIDGENYKSTIDCFSQLEFLDMNVLLFVNRTNLKLFDFRTEKVDVDFNLNLEPCNLICSMKTLGDSAFIATRHDFCKYDIRNLNDPSEHSSHFLSSPPCYMDIVQGYDDTLIALSSQKVDQKVLFGTKSLNKLPARFPSVLDTFKECRLRKDLLLRNDLEGHLTHSITGIKLIEDANEKFLFSSNYSGQLFKQRIHKESLGIQNPIDTLYNWLMKFPKKKETLNVTGIVEMSDVHSKFFSNKKGQNEMSNVQNDRCSKFLNKFSADYRKQNYGTMMNELVSIWEIDDLFLEDQPPPTEVQSTSKVADWIDSQVFKDDEMW